MALLDTRESTVIVVREGAPPAPSPIADLLGVMVLMMMLQTMMGLTEGVG